MKIKPKTDKKEYLLDENYYFLVIAIRKLTEEVRKLRITQ